MPSTTKCTEDRTEIKLVMNATPVEGRRAEETLLLGTYSIVAHCAIYLAHTHMLILDF